MTRSRNCRNYAPNGQKQRTLIRCLFVNAAGYFLLAYKSARA